MTKYRSKCLRGNHNYRLVRFEVRISEGKYTIYGYDADNNESSVTEKPIEGAVNYHTIDMVASKLSNIITCNNELLTMDDLFRDEEAIASYTKQVIDNNSLPHLNYILTHYLTHMNKKNKEKEKKLV